MRVLGSTMFLATGALLVLVVLIRSRSDRGQRERRSFRDDGVEIWQWFARFERSGGRVQDLEGLSWGDALRARKVPWLASGQLIALLLISAVVYLLGWPWWIASSLVLLSVVVGGYAGELQVFLADETSRTWRYQRVRGALVLGLVLKGSALAFGLGLARLSAGLVERGSVVIALLVAAAAAVVVDRCHVPARWVESAIRRRQTIDFAEGSTGDAILYLRSFDDDEFRMFAPIASSRWYAPVVPQRVRFEELVEGWTFREAPQVVAIGRPGERRPSLGAGRSYWTDETWQAAVRQTAARCKAVIVVAGTSEGLGWEISTLAEMGVLGKTLLLLPPDSPEASMKRYQQILAAGRREHDTVVEDVRALSAVPALGYTADGELVHYVAFGRDWAAYVSAETHLLRTLSGHQTFDEANNLTRLDEITDDPVAQAFTLSLRFGRPGDGRTLLESALAEGVPDPAERERLTIARAAAILAESGDAALALASLPASAQTIGLADARRALGAPNPSAEQVFRLVMPPELQEAGAPERHEKASAPVAMRLVVLWTRASDRQEARQDEGFLEYARAASALADRNGLDLARAFSDMAVAQALLALSRRSEAEALARDILTRDLPVRGAYGAHRVGASEVHDGAESVVLDTIDRSAYQVRRRRIDLLEAQYGRRRATNRRAEAAQSAKDLALQNLGEGDAAAAMRWGDLARVEFAALGNSRDEALTLTTLARAALDAKDPEASRGYADSALALIDANSFTEITGDALHARALAVDEIARHDPSPVQQDEAVAALRAVLALDRKASHRGREEALLGRLVSRLSAAGRVDEAVDAQRRVVQLRSSGLRADDPRTLGARLVLARLVRDSGDLGPAEAEVDELARVVGAIDLTSLPGLLEEIQLTQAGFAEQAGDVDRAVTVLDARETSIAARLGPEAGLRARRLAIGVLTGGERHAEALARQHALIEALGALGRADPSEVAEAIETRNAIEWRLAWHEATVLEDGGDFLAAAARHELWLRDRSVGGSGDVVRTAHSSASRGRCVALAGRTEEAARLLRDGHARAVGELGRAHEATRWFLTELARTWRRAGEHAAEVTVLGELHDDVVAAVGEHDRGTILATADLARAHDRAGQDRDARRLAALAVRRASLAFGADDEFTQRCRDDLSGLLASTDEHLDRSDETEEETRP